MIPPDDAGREESLDPPPLVSILIPCRNEREHIIPCLDSILAGDFPLDDLEVLVIDGMSDDGTAAIVRAYAATHQPVRLICNPQRIVPSALNIGIHTARGEIILRMDAHVEYPSNYVSGLVRWLDRTGADNVGGCCITLPSGGTPVARAIAVGLAHGFGVGDALFRLGVTKPRRVDTVPFGCFRKALFTRIGLFDEELVRNQDDEFNLRLIRAGGTVLLVPGIVSYYRARATLGRLARMFYQYGYFKPLVARKVGRIMTLRQLAPAGLVAGVVLSGALAPWIEAAQVLFALTLGIYLVAAVACSLASGLRYGVPVTLALLRVFPTLHLSYGFGFLRGVLDFIVLRRHPMTSVPLSR
jgi:glycosyltransferase involved in cell wall biosynthesis